MSDKKSLVILGSTGSVGKSTLSVVSLNSDKYSVYALTANSSVDVMLEQCREFSPKFAIMADEAAALELEKKIKKETLPVEILAGQAAIVQLIEEANYDAVMVAIVGAIGILPSIEAVKQGKQVLIANKEPLVMAGDLFMAEAKKSGATILPIDSEHNAIFQCLPHPFGKEQYAQIEQLVLTASGGPCSSKLEYGGKNIG